MASKVFCEAVLHHCNQVAPVTARAMFGGYGLYTNGVMFALIANDTLYFKVDDSNRDEFLAMGMKPFTYAGKTKPVIMPYYQLPEAVWHDAAMLVVWIEKSAAIARQAKTNRRNKKRL